MYPINPLTQIDFYKADHRRQYPAGTTEVYSNFTPRSAAHAPVLEGFDNKIVWFGLQGFITAYLIECWNDGFFNQPREEVVEAYRRRLNNALGKDAVPVDHIYALYDLGYLPIEIKSLPEGSRVNLRVPVLTIKNTHPDFSWLTNYLETVISQELWKPATVATIAYEYRRLLEYWADVTGAPREFIDWQAHDFSSRGMSGCMDAAASGAGHLLSFTGTDTVAAIDYLENFYGANSDQELIGGSVPATEHSVMCAGMEDDELGTFKRLINEVYPSGIVSIVSDTWDFWQVITEYAAILKSDILARDGKVVFRPDSGDPVRILCGYEDDEIEPQDDGTYAVNDSTGVKIITEAERQGAVACLWNIFGGTITVKGYKVLDNHVGLIYGDSITLARADEIMDRLARKGFASNNVVLGVGSYTYQYLTRDSFGWAMKATSVVVDGVRRDIAKNPKTDNGVKKSARGLLAIGQDTGGNFVLFDQQSEEQEAAGALRTVFKDGEPMRTETLATIRSRLKGAA